MVDLIKVRFSSVNIGNGGAERILYNLLNNLDSNKFEISLFLFEKSGNYLDNIPKHIKVFYFVNPEYFQWCKYLYKKFFRKIFFRFLMKFPSFVYKIAGCEFCDVDIAFLQDTSYLLKTNYAKKKIAWIHNNIEFSPTFKSGLKDNLEYADLIIGVSKGVSDKVISVYPYLKSRVITIYNPSDISQIINKSIEENIIYQKPTIIAVGTLNHQKNYQLLLKSFKILIDKGYDWELKILGTGDLREYYLSVIQDLGLGDQVKLLGFTDNPYKYMKSANVFVMSSIFEGFPQVMMEALALKIPVVSTDCDYGPREMLGGGKFGVLTPINDAVSLSAAIEDVILNRHKYQNTINNGYVESLKFDLKNIVPIIEKTIVSIL